MKPESDYIQELLKQLNEALSLIPEQFAKIQRQADREIDVLCEEAGIMGKVKAIRDSVESNKKRLQSQADNIQGRMVVLKDIHDKYHLAPIPDGVTHMYGIRLESLDPMSRLKLMHGKLEDEGWLEMIQVLGGDHTRRYWDGSEPEPVSTPEPVVDETTDTFDEEDNECEGEPDDEPSSDEPSSSVFDLVVGDSDYESL